jgi:porin
LKKSSVFLGRHSCSLRRAVAAGAGVLAVALPPAARAQGTPPAGTDVDPGFTTGLFASSRGNLLGTMGGLRTVLGNVGISLGLTETSEVLGNVGGGVHRGADYDGLTTMTLGLDTLKAFGWEGGSFNVSALQIHGRNLSADNLDNLQTASGIESNRATRLWELWYQQTFLDGLIDVKLGQQSIDQDFMTSVYSALFLNTMMGWPLVPSDDLYGGGPAYPLSSPGARLRAQLPGGVTVLGGVFDDNPPGGPFADDSQVRGAEQSGTKFNTGTGALFIAELQYALNQPSNGDMVGANAGTPGLPGTYKIGGWYDTAGFPDQRFDTAGLSLADPNSTGVPATRHRNFSLYAVMDQMVWQPDPTGPKSVAVFARAMGAPGDRDLIEFSLNAGISMKAPLPGRDDDTVGLGWGIGKVSSTASALDADTASFGGAPYPKRSEENFLELTYQYQIAPWWQVQPDAQYVFLPGGGIPDPNRAGKRIGNEAILGLRTNVTF